MTMDQSIADILEDCRVRLARGETIDGCLAAYPARASELAELLPTVVRARALAHEPDPSFSEAARRRFLATIAAARASQTSSRAAPLGWLRRLLVPVAAVLFLVVSGFGLVQASDGALPDSPLYPVKQAQERLLTVFVRSPTGRAALELRFANQRLRDLETAERLGKGPAVIRPLAVRMVEATDLAIGEIKQTPDSQRAKLVPLTRALLRRERRVLVRLAHGPNRQVAQTALELLRQLRVDEQSLSP